MAKEISRAAPPPQPTTGANTNAPANLGQPSPAERAEGRNPQQGQVDPKESKQHKDFQGEGDPAGPSRDAPPSS